ncbi:putative caffeate O-methyltransferase [Helianthus annuus]|nr:putative caffeate O-methyltransferase [Helianthus annuus]
MDSYKMSEEEQELLRVNQITVGILLPMVIKTAIELDLFEIMAKTPGGNFSSFDLASSLPRQTQETPVLIERILRFLASHSVVTSTVVKDEHGGSKNLYGMTALSYNYVRRQDGTSHASSLLFINDKVLVNCWLVIKTSYLRTNIVL